MSDAAFKTRTAAVPAAQPARIFRPALPVLAVAAVALLAGCAFQKRDSITVGAVPDDYRTNHPIVIAEKEEMLDLPVGASDRGATAPQRASLEGFLADYDRTAAPVLTITAPSGSANDVAAADAAQRFRPHRQEKRRAGEPHHDCVLPGGRRKRSRRRCASSFTGHAGADRQMRALAGRHSRNQREQALREFRLFLSEQRRRPDRQSGRPARAEKADADRRRESRCGHRTTTRKASPASIRLRSGSDMGKIWGARP